MSTEKATQYIETVGRRKTAVARVRLFQGGKGITVNGKDLASYFQTKATQEAVLAPLALADLSGKVEVRAKIVGGGIEAQAEALRHGISRAIVEREATLRPPLKQAGFLKRDPRAKERRKFGLKKARKAAQWSKR